MTDADVPCEEILCASGAITIHVANLKATHQKVSSIYLNDFVHRQCHLAFL